MRVVVQNNRADFDAFSEYLVRHRFGRAYKFFRYGLPIICAGGGLVLLLLLWWLHSRSHISTEEQLDMLVCAFLGLLFSFAWPLWKSFNFFMMRRKGNFGEPFTLELREDGVAIQRNNTWHQGSWSELHRVERTREYLFLLINTRAGLIVPLQSFPSADDGDTFAAFAVEHWQAAQTVPVVAPLAAP